ncbi:MAG: hypothetical protein CVU79_08630 [Elusimicrobia bacterium HGW-Elusimicrobia-3]|nr:MAG: hypothetical protein CVU79_08630 [Elusimicrobia bacterium HGW-Elusimicrobia-3]
MYFLAALAFICGPHLPALAGGPDCDKAAGEIISFSRANGIDRVSVLGFSARTGVDKSEADYISEKTGACLAGLEKPALIERALLEKVLKESRLSAAAGGGPGRNKEPSDIFLVDAVVTGTVFAAGKKLKVLTRLIEVRTGRVLLAVQSETQREWSQYLESPELLNDWDPADWALPPLDLRDAVLDEGKARCAERKMLLGKLNAGMVDAKARHWAAKMKEPGFSIRGLTRNPGTEITDPALKARFYKLLGAYYRDPAAAPPAAEALPALNGLLEEESKVYNECGYR